MEADKYIVRFEQPRFKLITSTEEVAATSGGLGGLVGSVVTVIELSRNSDVRPTVPNVSFHNQSIGSAPVNIPLPSISLITHSPTVSRVPKGTKNTQVTTEVAPSSHTTALPLKYEIGGVIGIVAIAAFVAASATSGIRYAIHKRKERFKSDISATELREWYDSPSTSATKDV